MAKKIVVTKKAEDAVSEVKTHPTATKKVAKVTPPPAPKAEQKAAPVATATEKKPSIHRGVKTGLSVMDYQDQTMLHNNKKKLTDEQIVADWRAEFPNTNGKWVHDDKNAMFVVRVVRKFFNLRQHGNQKVFSDTPVLRYNTEGKPLAEDGRGGKKAEPVKATAKAA